jgi:hypothetical protein
VKYLRLLKRGKWERIAQINFEVSLSLLLLEDILPYVKERLVWLLDFAFLKSLSM